MQNQRDWRLYEIMTFVLTGIAGGAIGAFLVKASRMRIKASCSICSSNALLETIFVALLTGLSCFWNKYTRLGDNELLSELFNNRIKNVTYLNNFQAGAAVKKDTTSIASLASGFVIKGLLTTITFGAKVPAGIYVPSMVIGGLLGEMIGYAIQMVMLMIPMNQSHLKIRADDKLYGATPRIYPMMAAGATLCGVTRLPVTVTILLVEMTGNMDYLVPFFVAIMVSKWISDAVEASSIYVSQDFVASNCSGTYD